MKVSWYTAWTVGAYLLVGIFCSLSAQPAVYINEWSQGPATCIWEFVELVVTQPTDLRGWQVRDENENANIATFSNDPIWANVPPGTIITIYNTANTLGGCTNLIPAGYASTSTADVCGRQIQLTNAASNGLFTSNWGSGGSLVFGNTTPGDNPILLDGSNTVIHDWDQGNAAGFTSGTIRPGSGQSVALTGAITSLSTDLVDPANWTRTPAASATPGQPNGGSNTTFINSLRPSTITASASASTIACGSSTTLTVTDPATPGCTSGATFSWAPGGFSGASVSVSPTASTVYTVTSTDCFGCTQTATVAITVTPLSFNAPTGITEVCEGASTPVTSLEITSPPAGVNFVWNPGNISGANPVCANPPVCSTVIDIPVPNSPNTTFTITGTDASGCTGTQTITINVNSTAIPPTLPNQTVCAGQSATVTVPNSVVGVNYQLRRGATPIATQTGTGGDLTFTVTAAQLPNQSGANNFIVRLTTAAGCVSNTPTFVITVTPAIVVSVSGTTTVCSGQTSVLTASGATTYTWSPATGLSDPNIANPTFNGTSTTTYTVTGTTAGCTGTTTVTVTVTPNPTVSVSGTTTICSGQTTVLTASGATTYTWAPATDLSDPNIANPTFNGTTTTTYTVTGTTAGCTGTTTVTVTVTPNPTVSVSGITTICSSQTTVLTASGATTYTWTPATGLSNPNIANPTFNGTATQTYTVTGTTAGCTGTTTVTVTIAPALAISVSGTTTVCSGQTSVLTASGATNYTWTPATGLSNPNIANPTFNGTATTTYTVTGTTAGCTGTTTVTVTVAPALAISVSGTTTVCSGQTTVLTASGATTYTWSPATGLSDPNIANPTFNGTATTTYTVTGTTAGCTGTTTVTVTVAPALAISVSGTTTVCSGQTTVLTASGATTYTWSPTTGLSDPNIANPTFNGTATTTYTVTGTTAGCTGTTTVTVTVTPNPTVSVSGIITVCSGQTSVLTASGATTYTWAPATGLSDPNIANPTFNGTSTQTYTVTGTTAGCTGTTTVTVTVAPALAISVSGTTTVCSGQTTVLTASGATTYTWSPATGLSDPNIANPTFNGTTTTTYTVTGTTAGCTGTTAGCTGTTAGCTGTTTVTVTVAPALAISVSGTTTVCSGQTSVLTASGATTYTWTPATGLSNPNIANPTFNGTSTQTYTVTGTTAGCTGTTTVTVTVNPNPTVSVSGTTTVCSGQTTVLTASGATTYTWAPATGLSNPNITNPTFSGTSTQTYTVTGTTAGCTGTTTVTVTVTQNPTVSVSGITTICSGQTTVLTASGATTYTWTPATGLSDPNIANPTFSGTSTETYTVTGTTAGCTGTNTVTVTIAPALAISVSGTTTVCSGQTTVLTASGATTYTWAPATGLSAPNIANPTFNGTSTTTYTVTGTTAGCTGTTTVTVTIAPALAISVSGTTTVCFGQTTVLTASGATTYTWAPATGLSDPNIANPTFNGTATQTYTVTGTTAGCTGTNTVTVTVAPALAISVSGTTTVCSGQNTVLTASGATTYTWAPATGLSDPNIANPTFNGTATATYTVTGTTAGCTGTATVTVTVAPNPTVSVSGTTTISANQTTILSASGASIYSWSPATNLDNPTSGNPVFGPAPAGTYTYTVTGTTAGCANTTVITITVNPINCTGFSVTATTGLQSGLCLNQLAVVTATPAGGTAPYTYAFEAPVTGLPFTVNANNTGTAQNVPAGNYVVIATDANGCTATAAVSITQNTPPNSFVIVPPYCIGTTTLTLTAAEAGNLTYAFNWLPTLGTTGSITVPATAGDSYTLTVTDASGCSSSTVVTLGPPVQPSATISGVPTFCPGTSTTLTATPTNTLGASPLIEWLSGSTVLATGNSLTLSTNTLGLSVRVTDSGTGGSGCTGTIAVGSIAVLPTPAPVITSNSGGFSICGSQQLTLSVTGLAAASWLRNGQPLGTGLNQLTAGAGTYLVTGTDVNGCTGTAEVLISTGGGTPFTVSASLTEVCAVRPVTLTASDPNLSYSWAPGNAAGQTVSLAVAPNTTITVTATNTGGCTSTQTLTIGPASGLIPQVTISEPLTCIQNATLSVTPAVSGFTYQWSDGIITGPTRTNTGAGTYTVTVTDPATGCSGSASVAIAAPTGPVILQETITNIACFGGSTGRIQLTLSQPLDVQSIAWTGPNGFTASSLTISDLVAGSYTIRVTNAAGCVLQQTYTLTEPPLLNATTTVTEEICGVPGKATTNVTGGVPPYAFAWAGTDGYASTQQNPMDLTGGTYTLTVTDANTCTATLTVTIGQNLNFTPGVVAATITICEGQTTTLTATGAQIYAWAPGGSVMGNNNTASVTVQPATTTTFTVLGTLGSCTGTATILVVVTPKPATIDTLVATCPNEPLNLIRPGVGRWGWEPQTGVLFINDNQVVLNPAANAVDYTVTVPVGVECSTPGRVRFTRYPADTTRIRQTPAEPLAGQGFVLEALGSAANTYRWQFIDSLNGNPAKVGQTVSHVFQRPGEQTIELTTTTPEGCTSRQTLRRIYQPSPVEVPSVFSPNGDDLNDRFGVVGFFTYQTYSLLIFDRWGNQIFEANSPTQTWDGTKNRNRVPEGVYVYRLTIRFEANQPLLERAGTITVVR